MNDALRAVLTEVAEAIDEHEGLTRVSASGLPHTPELVFNSDGWFVRCALRGTRAKGRGAKTMHDASLMDFRATPEAAGFAFIVSLEGWSKVLNDE